MSKLGGTAAVLFFVLVADSLAQGQNEPKCGTFEVVHRLDAAETLDSGDKGPSPGDQRILRYFAYDVDDNQIGQMLIVATVMHQRSDGDYDLHSSLVHSFANGTITSVESPKLSKVLQTNVSPDHVIEGAVTGGTGAFAGVTGATSAEPIESGVYRRTFTLSCPQ